MTYAAQVKRAAACLVRGEDANWELARLTFEACGPAPGHGGRPKNRAQEHDSFVTIARWSADVIAASGRRFSPTIASRYRQVHERFADARVLDPPRSWTEAWNEVLNRMPDTSDPPLTLTGLVANSGSAPPPPPEQHEFDREAFRRRGREINAEERQRFQEKDNPLHDRVVLGNVVGRLNQWNAEIQGVADYIADPRFATWPVRREIVDLLVAMRDVFDGLIGRMDEPRAHSRKKEVIPVSRNPAEPQFTFTWSTPT